MQTIRLRGPGKLLPYLFPDLWLLYRLYQSARASDAWALQQANLKRQAAQRERQRQQQMLWQSMQQKANVQQSKTSASNETTSTEPPKPRLQSRPYTPGDLEQDLGRVIGLNTVKENVRDIYAHVMVEKQRAAKGLVDNEGMSLHMVFYGNPGTGKTTIARLVGEMFARMGVLSQGQFIETSGLDLVGRYLGESPNKARECIARAKGGVLFVDEAYGLYNKDNPGASDYGKQVIDVFVKAMEDDRDDLCVIFAGYYRQMQDFIKVNPGMRSRIPFELNFDDYSAAELMKIISKMCAERSRRFDQASLEYLQSLFAKNVSRVGELGNGRWARDILEAAIRKQSRRLFTNTDNSREVLQTFTLDDVQAWEVMEHAHNHH